MRVKTAQNIITEIVDRYVRERFAFDANLYDKGIVTIRTEKAHEERKRIRKAMEVVKNGTNT